MTDEILELVRKNPKGFSRKWNERYSSDQTVLDMLKSTIFEGKEWVLERAFKCDDGWKIDRIALRYYLLKSLVESGHLSIENLHGSVIDIGSFMGCSIDSLAMFGARVNGTDTGCFACFSPSGIEIHGEEGVRYVEHAISDKKVPDLVTCFNASWVEEMSWNRWCVDLYDTCMKGLKRGGQVLMTYAEPCESKEYLAKEKRIIEIELPENLRGMERYVLIGTR